MINRTERDTGLFGRIRSLIPGRKPQTPAVVLTTQPPEVPVTVAQKEHPPRVLSPFEQIQQLLERESGIADPEQDRREVNLEKKVRNPYTHSFVGGAEDPVQIIIRQGVRNKRGDGSLSVSIHVTTDHARKEYNKKHHLRGPEVSNLYGSLVISEEEPKLTLNPNPRHSSYPFNDPEGIWGILGLSRPEYESDTRIWSHKTVPGKGDFYTTNNERELGKVVRFITVDETGHSTPKVISRR